MRGSRLLIGIVLVALGIVAFSSVFTVNEREQALVLQFGEVKRLVKAPGLHFKIPLVQNVTYYDKRVLDFAGRPVEVPTKDQKQVVVDSYTRYRIVDPLKFFQTVTNELGMRKQLAAIVDSAVRQQFGSVEMATILTPDRAKLMRNVAKNVAQQGVQYGIKVLDVRLRRVDLPEENSQAIFKRMQSQREQEARRIRAEGEKESKRIQADADKRVRVIRAEAEKKAEILRGEGDAEAQRLYNVAFGRDKVFYDFWVRMRTARESLMGKNTRYVGPPQLDLFRMFPDVTSGSPKAPQPVKQR
jgi:membrane protease subunit HflC